MMLTMAPLLLGTLGAVTKPNVFILLTDDQDDLLNSTIVQPNLLSRVGGEGVRFVNGFVNHPVCCVSRSSLLTGRYSHNTHVINNSRVDYNFYPGNCTSPAWAANMEPRALAVHLQRVGYRSIYMGKYMNDAHTHGSVPPKFEHDPFAYIPPGWDEWYGLQGNSKYYNYSVSNNGMREDHGYAPEDYLTLRLEKRAHEFLNAMERRNAERAGRNEPHQPFFMMIGTPAAHANFIPPPGYWDLSDRGVGNTSTAPRTPNHNVVCEHCHLPLRHYRPMTSAAVAESDDIWRRRLGTLAFVDDMLGRLLDTLDAQGELSRTLMLYTADNGFHLGQWAQGFDKRQMYETDLRVPYFVRCPGCLRGARLDEPVSHVDIAATVLDFAGVALPTYFDGRSFKPLLLPSTTRPARAAWDPSVFVQYFGESFTGRADEDFIGGCGCGIDSRHSAPGSPYPGGIIANPELLDPHTWPLRGHYVGAPCDGWNNTYTCTRKVATPASPGAYMFCVFDCFEPHTKRPMACAANTPEGLGEFYDMDTDPWQLKNEVGSLAPARLAALRSRVEAMRSCEGQASVKDGGCMA